MRASSLESWQPNQHARGPKPVPIQGRIQIHPRQLPWGGPGRPEAAWSQLPPAQAARRLCLLQHAQAEPSGPRLFAGGGQRGACGQQEAGSVQLKPSVHPSPSVAHLGRKEGKTSARSLLLLSRCKVPFPPSPSPPAGVVAAICPPPHLGCTLQGRRGDPNPSPFALLGGRTKGKAGRGGGECC